MSKYEDYFENILQSLGYKRNRDYYREYKVPIGYSLDFYFPDIRQCYEIDGRQHRASVRVLRDRIRDSSLKRYGISTVRIDVEMLERESNRVRSIVIETNGGFERT